MAEISNSAPATRAHDSSAGELVKQLTEQMSRLLRDELKLAEIEMTRKAGRAGRGIAAFGGSGLIALYGIGCLLAAAIVALAGVISAWLAALIVGVVLLAAAGLAALIGRGQLKKVGPPVPKEAVQNVKADVEEIKESAHR